MRYGMSKKVFCAQCAAQLPAFARSTRELYHETKKQDWAFISMKNDLQDIFPFEKK